MTKQPKSLETRGIRVFLDSASAPKEKELLTLSESDRHHLTNVLRLKPQDLITICDTSGRWRADSEIVSIYPLVVSVSKSAEIIDTTQSHPAITALVGLCKSDKGELVTDWLTELGVSQIIHFQADHSVSKLKDPKDLQKKELKFRARAEAAAKQSKRNSVPVVSVKNSLRDCFMGLELENSQNLFCSLSGEAKLLNSIKLNLNKKAVITVGPEGDFSSEEIKTLLDCGFKAVSLGENVLRSELAAVVAVSALKFELMRQLPEVK